MATTVCVDDCTFDVSESGKLVLKIDGAPDHQGWPSVDGSTAADCNPLRCDSNGGLWVPPPADSAATGTTVDEDSDDQALSDSFSTLLVADFDLTNPSECLKASAFVFFVLEVSWDWPSIPSSVDEFFSVEFQIEFDRGDGGGYGGSERLGRFITRCIGTTEVTVGEFWSYEGARQILGFDAGETRHCKFRVSGKKSVPISTVTVTDIKINTRSLLVTQT